MKIHGIPRIFRITTHRWEFHPSASTAPLHPCPIIRGWSVAWCAWTVTTRHFESNFQPAESYPTPGQGKGWGCSPGKGGHSAGSAKKRQKEREREKKQKTKKGRESERWKSTEEPAELFAYVRPLLFFQPASASAGNSIFVSARDSNDSLPRSTELHPPFENELSSFERLFVTDPPTFASNGRVVFVLRARRPRRRLRCVSADSPRVIRRCVYRASVGVTG